MIYKDQLGKIFAELNEYQQSLIQEYNRLPEGVLYVKEMQGKAYCYRRVPKGGNHKKEHRYGISSDAVAIRELVRKRYISEALPLIEEDLRVLKAALESYQPFDERTLMPAIRASYPLLEDGLFDTKTDLNGWAKDHVPLKGFYEKDLRSVAADGELIRSKGELYIKSRLDHYEIEYRYEAPIGIPGLFYVPDFTIRRRRDRKLIYWEHLGKVTDKKYMNDNRKKFDDYERYGIVPWDNLVITYDYENGGLNAKMIDAMIEAWLL
ncbi:MAG: hypothetical protein IJH91_08955 [Mogibacterium sp.]|nr:hypothetical protein [Mogibacterium sp.]